MLLVCEIISLGAQHGHDRRLSVPRAYCRSREAEGQGGGDRESRSQNDSDATTTTRAHLGQPRRTRWQQVSTKKGVRANVHDPMPNSLHTRCQRSRNFSFPPRVFACYTLDMKSSQLSIVTSERLRALPAVGGTTTLVATQHNVPQHTPQATPTVRTNHTMESRGCMHVGPTCVP